MKAPIAQRQVTGARRIPRRRRLRGVRAPLRRPLSLLYRQSGKAGTAAPAAVRAADGRAVPLAPRLQIALHLSLTLNEQHRAFAVFAPPRDAAPAIAAGVPTERSGSTSERLAFAAHSTRVEPAHRTPAGALPAAPKSFRQAHARAAAAQEGRQDGPGYAGPGFRQIALLIAGRPAHGSGGPAGSANPSDITPPWPLRQEGSGGAAGPAGPANPSGITPPWPRQEAGAAKAAYIASGLPGHRRVRVTRLDKRPAVVRARHASSGPVTHRTLSAPAHRGGGGHIDAPAGRPAPADAAFRLATLLGAPAAPGTTPPLYLAQRQSGRSTAPAAFGSRPGLRSEGPAGHAGVAPPWPLRQEAASIRPAYIVTRDLAGHGRPLVTPFRNRPAVARVGAAARHASSGPATYLTLFTAAHRGGGGRIDAAAGRAAPPAAAADRLATASGAPAAPAIAALLHLAERQSGRTAGPASFGSAWAPPPLDFRSAPPPPPSARSEAPPSATPARPAAPVDLGAISRDVISRIEKRLRVERERRGRS